VADKVLGIDFGATGIKIAEVQTGKDSSTVVRQLFMPLEADLVHRGSIHPGNVGRIASELKMFLGAQKVLTRDAIMGIGAADEVFVNRTITNWHDAKDFHTAVGFEISANPDLLPGAREGVIMDAVVFGELQDSDGHRKLDTLLIGVNPSVIETQIQVLQKAGLRIAGSDLTAFGLLRARSPRCGQSHRLRACRRTTARPARWRWIFVWSRLSSDRQGCYARSCWGRLGWLG